MLGESKFEIQAKPKKESEGIEKGVRTSESKFIFKALFQVIKKQFYQQLEKCKRIQVPNRGDADGVTSNQGSILWMQGKCAHNTGFPQAWCPQLQHSLIHRPVESPLRYPHLFSIPAFAKG